MTHIMTIDERPRRTAMPDVFARVKSAAVAAVTHRYVHLAVISTGMTLASIMLVGVSLEIALSQPQQHIVRSIDLLR